MERQSKRPYEQPRLEASEVFGAEAGANSCCRNTGAACPNAVRDTSRTTIDAAKGNPNIFS